MTHPDTPAPAHGEALAHVVAELLRFHREGPSTDRYPFGLEDVTTILAEALLFTLRTETEAASHDPDAAEEASHGGQLCAALVRWLEYATGKPLGAFA